MKVKVTGVVKYGGKWCRPGDLIDKVSDEIAKQMVEQDIAEIIDGDPSDELQELRDRAIELGVPKAKQLGEAKLIAGIAEKEAELQRAEVERLAVEQLEGIRKTATELGIEGAANKNAETLIAEIESVEKAKEEPKE